eukprot:766748-Hanusia_phi.AAC.12
MEVSSRTGDGGLVKEFLQALSLLEIECRRLRQEHSEAVRSANELLEQERKEVAELRLENQQLSQKFESALKRFRQSDCPLANLTPSCRISKLDLELQMAENQYDAEKAIDEHLKAEVSILKEQLRQAQALAVEQARREAHDRKEETEEGGFEMKKMAFEVKSLQESLQQVQEERDMLLKEISAESRKGQENDCCRKLKEELEVARRIGGEMFRIERALGEEEDFAENLLQEVKETFQSRMVRARACHAVTEEDGRTWRSSSKKTPSPFSISAWNTHCCATRAEPVPASDQAPTCQPAFSYTRGPDELAGGVCKDGGENQQRNATIDGGVTEQTSRAFG